MKVTVDWLARPYPNNWEFSGSCYEGSNIEISGKIDEKIAKTAPSPKELLLHGVASCTAIDVVSMLQKMRQPLESLSVECFGLQTVTVPKVFESCELVYRLIGKEIDEERVAYAVFLSFTKYCGVSTMLKRSGCPIEPRLFINGIQIDIWDPHAGIKEKLTEWAQKMRSKGVKGFALITGASRGVGAALVQKYMQEGYAVLATMRQKGQHSDQENIFDALYLDITLENSVKELVKILEHAAIKLDLVLHNAGVANFGENTNALDIYSMQNLRTTFETNLFGVIAAQHAFMPLIAENAVVALTSSIMGHKTSEGYNACAYRLSKGALIQYTYEAALQIKQEGKKIAFCAYHPGSVVSDMNPAGSISTIESAEHIFNLVRKEQFDTLYAQNGLFWTYSNEQNKWIIP